MPKILILGFDFFLHINMLSNVSVIVTNVILNRNCLFIAREDIIVEQLLEKRLEKIIQDHLKLKLKI